MMIDEAPRPEHSNLGASGAERWMNCPGSAALLKELKLPENDEPDYRREGIAMHEAAADCLVRGLDTWEITGQSYYETVIEPEMARAIQVYLDTVRPLAERAIQSFVEYPISSPVHPQFYGRLDFGAILQDSIDIVDLKGGEGIIVDPFENPQIMYYGFGLIDGEERASGVVFPDELPVHLGIVQPRGFSLEGPVRWWTSSVGEIKEWVHSVLVPAMCATEYDNSLDAGPWCRFCSAKLVCPLLTSLFRAACTANPKEIVNISDASLDRSYHYLAAVKFYVKAFEDETMRRLMTGKAEISEAKLVKKRSNRVFKAGAADLAKARFGDDAFTKPELKSPPELEKVSPAAKQWVHEFAYLPDTGYTVAAADDKRPGIKVKPGDEVFAHYINGDKEL